MPTIRIEPVVIETAGWTLALRALLEMMQEAIPEAQQRERDALRGRAKQGGWDAAEYFNELQQVDLTFETWLPRLTGYSAIVLLQSLVERQLLAVCQQLHRSQGLKLAVREVQGSPIDRAKTYLTKVANIDIANDLGWDELRNLQELRNIIVHRLGKPGASSDDQKNVNRLLEYYSGNLGLDKRPDGFEAELEVPRSLCNHFLEQVAEFFKRLFQKAGLLDVGDWFPTTA